MIALSCLLSHFLEEKNKCFSDVKRVNIAKLIV